MITQTLPSGEARDHADRIDDGTHDALNKVSASKAESHHRLALKLLEMPQPPERVVKLIRALPSPALRWLWSAVDSADNADGEDPVAAFAEACRLLTAIPLDAADLTPVVSTDRLARLLDLLRHAWRGVPPGLLAKMLTQMPSSGAPDRLLQIQIQHVAVWGATRGRRMTSAVRRDWSIFVGVAMKYQHNDEIALRMAPRSWRHPFEKLRVLGFDLTPIVSTEQLVCAGGHQGALCSSKVADACEQGTEAWWLAHSSLGVPAPTGCIPVEAAIALVANADQSWRVGPVLAPPHSMQAALQIARSLVAQAEVERNLELMRRFARGRSLPLPEVHEALVALLAQHDGVKQSAASTRVVR